MKLIPVLLLCMFFSACSQTTGPSAESQTVEGVWIDVRTPQEFAAGHVTGAFNLPHDEIRSDHELLSTLPKDETLLLYCRSGRRSGIAKNLLEEMGFTVRNVGGFGAAREIAGE